MIKVKQSQLNYIIIRKVIQIEAELKRIPSRVALCIACVTLELSRCWFESASACVVNVA
jgi:hypothetical protein